MAKFKIESYLEKETKNYMKDVIKKLSDKDCDIESDWIAPLTMLAENYDTFIKSKKQIQIDGMMIKNRFGDWVAHPLIKVSENANIQCLKLMLEFSLTKKSSMKVGEVGETKEDDKTKFDKFIEKGKYLTDDKKIEKR